MTVALLYLITLTALSGMAPLAIEDGEGPFAGIIAAQILPTWALEYDHDHDARYDTGGGVFEKIHDFAANASLFLILLHLAGVISASHAHGENLLRSMLTGRKPGDG